MDKQPKAKEQEQFGFGNIPKDAINDLNLIPPFTKGEFHRILDRASQPVKKSEKEKP